jgi:hypothetical protein
MAKWGKQGNFEKKMGKAKRLRFVRKSESFREKLRDSAVMATRPRTYPKIRGVSIP